MKVHIRELMNNIEDSSVDLEEQNVNSFILSEETTFCSSMFTEESSMLFISS